MTRAPPRRNDTARSSSEIDIESSGDRPRDARPHEAVKLMMDGEAHERVRALDEDETESAVSERKA
ncbi:Hypothetical protein A7982_10683 [Minicystis rosea]|nr:Hypothetical protein A7982_10683 [Minicystis rosea]